MTSEPPKINLTNGQSSFKKQSELHTTITFTQFAAIPSNTTCIWEYIKKVHYNSARFFNFNYQPNMWHSIKPSSNLFKLKLWRYYTQETLCTGPVYDMDLINIGNLNCTVDTSTTMTSNVVSNSDESWYPVPIKNASDYHEQLDQILPSQYEILLRQIMCKYKLSESCAQTKSVSTPGMSDKKNVQSPNGALSGNSILDDILANDENLSQNLNAHINSLADQKLQFNWKNIWDYFYQAVSLVELK